MQNQEKHDGQHTGTQSGQQAGFQQGISPPFGVRPEIASNLALALSAAHSALSKQKPLSQTQSTRVESALNDYKQYCSQIGVTFTNESIEQ